MSIWDSLPKEYKGFRKSFSLYWKNYGGGTSLVRSPYFHFSLVLTIIACPLWGTKHDPAWYELSLSALPNLLGFTLGGYAILLAFGDEQFRRMLSGRDSDGSTSPFMGINSIFVHFILVQVIAIVVAIFGCAWELKSGIVALLGFFCFCYSILIAAAAAMTVLRVANWFDIWKTRNRGGPSQGH